MSTQAISSLLYYIYYASELLHTLKSVKLGQVIYVALTNFPHRALKQTFTTKFLKAASASALLSGRAAAGAACGRHRQRS